uniref:Uncharacterized protein n=1 Tax=Cacopsylla melanoneura TaxID=428564 RepID=A0A8D9EA94_9HEMI
MDIALVEMKMDRVRDSVGIGKYILDNKFERKTPDMLDIIDTETGPSEMNMDRVYESRLGNTGYWYLSVEHLMCLYNIQEAGQVHHLLSNSPTMHWCNNVSPHIPSSSRD